MKERLQEFIRTEGLRPAKFAELMDVGAPGVSHILSGRNKPNYDFIAKMLSRFPALNPDWLILGEGEMYRTDNVGVSALSKPSENSLNEPNEATGTGNLNLGELSKNANTTESQAPQRFDASSGQEKFADKSDSLFNQKDEIQTDRAVSPSAKTISPSQAMGEPEASTTVANKSSNNTATQPQGKNIDKIVIFYSDQTFSYYSPSEP